MPLIPMSPQKQLALRVSQRRKILGLTQAGLAKLAGTSQTGIARLEAGHGNPTISLIQRVCTALDLTLTLYIRPELDTLNRT
ncbi:MAG: putative transcriptional regulator, family [Patescibacteria group bacterium]|nr:putative transcriptional regulator, family [Patescibacteria group bacterium]